MFRRIVFPAFLAAARFRTRRGRTLLVAVGVAVGAGLLAAVLAGSLAAQDRSLARAIGRIPAVDRAARADWSGTPGQGSPSFVALDRTARRAFRELARRPPFAVAVFAETELGSVRAPVDLGAIEGLDKWIRLTSGRLPRSCSARRCEVVRVAGRAWVPHVHGLRFVVVGTGRLRSPLPLGGLVSATSRQGNAPFLLAPSIRPLADSAVLAYDERTYSWVLPVDRAGLHPWSTGGFVDSIVRANSVLAVQDPSFQLTAPQDSIVAADDTARIAGRRLLLLGGEAAALLLAFTVLAAARMRRDADAASRRLTWFGATRAQIAVTAVVEAVAVGVVGALAGWVAGAALGALMARHLGSPAGAVLRHSVLGSSGVLLALAAAGVAALVLLAALRAKPVRLGRLQVSAVDVAAVAAVAAVALALARGVADEQSLASQRGTGLVLLLLPGLIVFAAAVVAARILVPALRLLERAGRRGPVSARLAALSVARNPGHAAVTVAFLVVSLGLALFAATYRSTLVQGQRDEAAFAVPRDEIVSENLSRLVSVTEAAPLAAYRRLGAAAPVVRLSGDVPDSQSASGLTLLGIPASALPSLDGWRGDFSSLSPAGLARRLRPRRSMALRGPRFPPTARLLELPVAARSDDLTLTAVIETRRGGFATVRLGEAQPSRPAILRAALPRAAGGGRLVAIDPELPFTGLHDSGNSVGPVVVAHGTAVLGVPRVDGRKLHLDYGGWIGADGMRPLGPVPGGGIRVRFLLTSDRNASFRPRQPTDGLELPVVASPAAAAAAGPGGRLALDVADQTLPAHVVATATHFPSIDGEFVVADRATLATALNTAGPGTGETNEIWLDARHGNVGRLESKLRRAPFSALAVSSRRAVQAGLAAEPLARVSLLVLEAGALAALVLALGGLLLAVLTDLRDERGELIDLEAQGASPALLRRQVRLRALLVAAAGVLGGAATGALLAGLVVRLVTLTANAVSPESASLPEAQSLPSLPLRLDLDWPLLLVALAVLAALAWALVSLPTLRAFRSPAVARPGGDS